MSLTEQDTNYIREVVTNVASKVSKEVISDVLKWHIQSCPHGKTILASKWGLIGLCVGSGLTGAFGGISIFAAISKMLG